MWHLSIIQGTINQDDISRLRTLLYPTLKREYHMVVFFGYRSIRVLFRNCLSFLLVLFFATAVRYTQKVFPTSKNKWVTVLDNLVVNDDPQTAKFFEKTEKVNFFYNTSNLDQVKSLLQVCEIPFLSNSVSRDPITYPTRNFVVVAVLVVCLLLYLFNSTQDMDRILGRVYLEYYKKICYTYNATFSTNIKVCKK